MMMMMMDDDDDGRKKKKKKKKKKRRKKKKVELNQRSLGCYSVLFLVHHLFLPSLFHIQKECTTYNAL